MVRPIKPRRVLFSPNVVYFKPRAVPLSLLDEVDLGIDELEALRLCDYKNNDFTEFSHFISPLSRRAAKR